MLVLKRANVRLKNKLVLVNLSVKILPGEMSVLVGENGIGKSSFANAIAAGGQHSIEGEGKCLDASLSGRSAVGAAKSGVFLAFQNPIEIPGVLYVHFLKLVASKISGGQMFLKSKLLAVSELFKLDASLLHRPVNVGFSGGERRLFEMMQMVVIEPKLCILDEPDSGLDSNRLTAAAELILGFSVWGRSMLVITHSLKLLALLAPDSVFCLTKSGVLNYGRSAFVKRC